MCAESSIPACVETVSHSTALISFSILGGGGRFQILNLSRIRNPAWVNVKHGLLKQRVVLVYHHLCKIHFTKRGAANLRRKIPVIVWEFYICHSRTTRRRSCNSCKIEYRMETPMYDLNYPNGVMRLPLRTLLKHWGMSPYYSCRTSAPPGLYLQSCFPVDQVGNDTSPDSVIQAVNWQ